MPFFNSDDLQQLAKAIAAMSQQLTAQQRHLDQLQQGTSVSLTETRAVVRDSLATITTDLASIRSALQLERTSGEAAADHLNDAREVARRALAEQRDLNAATMAATVAAIRADVEQFIRPAPEAPTEAASAPTVAPEAAAEDKGHGELLKAAAGISAAKLTAHRDTWAFLVEHAGQDRHFHIPGDITADGGTVTVDVSGRSLVAALTSLQAVHAATGADPGTAAIAEHLYDRIKKTVNAVAAEPHTGNGAEPVTIVIDDRAKPDAAQPATGTEPEADAGTPADGGGPAGDEPDGHLGD